MSDTAKAEAESTSRFLRWLVRFFTILVFALVALGMWGCPQYNVYHQRMEGEAAYAKAEQDRQIVVRQAQAKLDAATHEANAEIARARGVAEANKIIGESLKENEAYLRYLWITNLDHGTAKEVIYIPTEAGIPILEAGRVGSRPAPPRQ